MFSKDSYKGNYIKYACDEGGYSLTHSARAPPAVHPGMTIWGAKGGPPHFFVAKFYFLCYLERHANPFWEKSTWIEKRKKKKE